MQSSSQGTPSSLQGVLSDLFAQNSIKIHVQSNARLVYVMWTILTLAQIVYLHT